ncbi:hypothetical protein ABT301_35440 [Streptomyces sp. NPDC000987]|uniref:hypothetical protein n=1 Tax=Streptomyces sp. NPDC000987 TaxID=3154374 RepID=UPI0033331B83
MSDEEWESAAAAETGKTTRDSEPADTVRSNRPDRTGLLIAGGVLAACGGLVLYGVLDAGRSDSKPEHHAPTASVTYEVTGSGTADLTYQARSEAGKATVVRGARLPWRRTVEVPVGQNPLISIVLGEDGGTARCALAVRGRYVQSATATGNFGRATCSGSLPAAEGAKQG